MRPKISSPQFRTGDNKLSSAMHQKNQTTTKVHCEWQNTDPRLAKAMGQPEA